MIETSSTNDKKQTRETKYCKAIAIYMAKAGHATNADILEALRGEYPELSATTVHRVTARLAARNDLAIAPAHPQGSMRYDANTTEHDHFMCSSCGRLRDVDIAKNVRHIIESQLEGCHISGRVTVTGLCKYCSKKESV